MNTDTTKVKLSDLFSQDRYPYQATIPLGEGESLRVTYRAGTDALEAKVRVFLRGQVSALGLDPDVAMLAFAGKSPEGEDAARFEEACAALGDSGAEKITNAVRLTGGYALSLRLGSLTAVDAKGEHPSEELTPEACLSLPEDVQRTLLRLSQEAVAPAEGLDFFAGSRASSRG